MMNMNKFKETLLIIGAGIFLLLSVFIQEPDWLIHNKDCVIKVVVVLIGLWLINRGIRVRGFR